jgi:translocation and assembly module TamA
MAWTGRPSGWLLMLCGLLLSACGGSEENGPLGREETDTAELIQYDVRIAGEMPEDLRSLLHEASEAQRLTERPPASALVLRRRAEGDIETLQAALRSRGYYDGRITFSIMEDPAAAGDGGPLARPGTHVVFDVQTGPLYRLGPIAIEAEGADDDLKLPTADALGLAPGGPAEARAVLDAEQRLLQMTRKQSRPLASLGRRTTIVDHDRRAMEVTLRVVPGPKAAVGSIVFAGDAGISETYLRRRLPYASGDAYDPDLIARGRRNLVDSNLFSSVIVELGGGVSYQTDVGPGVQAYWEHRNLLSAGELLRAEINVDPTDQEARLSFRKPEIWTSGLTLLAETAAEAQDTDAFDSKSLRAGTGLEYRFTDHLLGGLGVAYRYADIKDADGRETFGLLSFPARVDWDFSDDLLDPSRGGRLQLLGAPYFDTLGSDTRFFKSQLVHTRYLSLLDDRRLVLALRGAVGSITGASRESIPADERFYSGGGGSVRGIPFQLAGPLDDDDEPIGGRSNLEFSIELRTRFTETLGGVAFLDGGSAFESSFPDFGEALRFGTGVGLRYITPVGPLRLDVGVPIDRRRGIDDAFQFYVSIGQAF